MNKGSKMDKDLLCIIERMATNYKRMLQEFRPCKPGGEFLEQNLVTLLCAEFSQHYPEGITFSEIPFMESVNAKKEVWSKRLDGYVATKEHAYLIEAKGSLSRTDLLKAVDADLDRIYSEELKLSFKKMAQDDGSRNYNIPSSVKGLVIANTWSKNIAAIWGSKSGFDNFDNLSKLHTIKLSAGVYNGQELFILVGVTNNNVWPN